MSIANGDGLWADCLLPLKEGTAWRVREITSNDDWGQGLQEHELARLKDHNAFKNGHSKI